MLQADVEVVCSSRNRTQLFVHDGFFSSCLIRKTDTAEPLLGAEIFFHTQLKISYFKFRTIERAVLRNKGAVAFLA